MDNSKAKKEEVSRTHQGVDGYTTIAAYLGIEGWNIGLDLCAGSQHSAFATDYFPERVFPRIERLVVLRSPADSKVLMRKDSGFDGAHLLFMQATEKDRWAAQKRSFDIITKWNPRKQNKEVWVAQAEAAGVFVEARPGKRVVLLNLDFKHLASFAYNCLRFLGQQGLTGDIAPVLHPAKRRRLKAALQEIMYRVAKFVAHARRLVQDFGRSVAAHANVFNALHERVLRVASP